jgi:hypothetical protein
MTARTTVTLQCDGPPSRTRDEHCHGIVQHQSPSIPMARYRAGQRGWLKITKDDGRTLDVCPHCAQRYPQGAQITSEEEATP